MHTYPTTQIYFPFFWLSSLFKTESAIFAFLLPYCDTSLGYKPISSANIDIGLGSCE